MLDDQITTKIQPHPLTAGHLHEAIPAGLSVAEIIRQHGPDRALGLPRVFLARGDVRTEVPVAMWGVTRPKPGTRVEVRFDPPEGAAISAIIPQLASGIVKFIAPNLAVGGLGFKLATAAVSLLGALAVSALIPPPEQPKQQKLDKQYLLTGAGNSANPYGTYPKVVGRRRMFPPKSAGGYSEQIGKTAYWRGRFCFGWGPLFLEDIRIGNTPITEFEDVQIEFLNIDKDRTLAANPGLENIVFDGLSSRHSPNASLGATGEEYVFSPQAVIESGFINFEIRMVPDSDPAEIVGQQRVVDGEWVTVETFTITENGEFSYDLPAPADGQLREYRLLVVEGGGAVPVGPSKFLFDLFGSYGSYVTEAFCTFPAGGSVPGWRSGTERMSLYQDDVFEEGFDVLLNDAEPVVRVSQKNTEEIAVDLEFKYGCYNAHKTGNKIKGHSATVKFEYRRFGEQDWIDAGTKMFSVKSKEPFRVSYPILVSSAGEWEVRCTRIGAHDDDDEDENRIWLTAIRSFQTNDMPSHDGVAEIAVRFKATDELNGQIENINAIVNQLVPVWDGAAWSDPQPNRHPAWALADWLRGPHSRRPVVDSKIDLDAIKAWADEEPHWTCDQVFDTEARMIDGANLIAATGRATMHLSDMRYSIIRDGGAGAIQQVFTPRNSSGFNLQVDYRRELHGLRVQFISERKQWQQEEVTIYMDGFDATNATEFETLQLEGVILDENEVDLANVYRLARYHMAQAVLRPETFEWQADFENLKVTRGDKVRVVNDVVKIGHGQGRIKSFRSTDGQIDSLDLDEKFPLELSTPYRLTVRQKNGDLLSFSAEIQEEFSSKWAVLDSGVPDANVGPGDLVIVEEMTQESYDLLITSIQPSEHMAATITATNAAPEVLQADQGDIPAFDPAITEPISLFGPPPPVPTQVFSDQTTTTELPGGAVSGHIGVRYASIQTHEPFLVRLRWSVDGGLTWTEGEALPPGSAAITSAIPEGESVLVEIRSESLDGTTRGWVRAGEQDVQPIVAPYIGVEIFVANAIMISEGGEQKPAIELTWDGAGLSGLQMTWEVRTAGQVVDQGRSVSATAGRVVLSEGILPRTAHECRLSLTNLAAGAPVWTNWESVTTGSANVRLDDLATEVSASIDAAAQSALGDKNAAELAAQNAEASAEQSDLARQSAAAEAAAALVSQASASDSAASASTSETNAANSASQSGQSAAASANSASVAATHASDAGQSASAADTDRIAAETARGQAQTYATQSAASADDAEGASVAAINSQEVTAEIAAAVGTKNLVLYHRAFDSETQTGWSQCDDDDLAGSPGGPAMRLRGGAKMQPNYTGNMQARRIGGSLWVNTQESANPVTLILRGGDGVLSAGIISNTHLGTIQAGLDWHLFEFEGIIGGVTDRWAPAFDLQSSTDRVLVSDLFWEDRTESSKAESAASAASTSEQNAAASENEAGQHAAASQAARTGAETARGGAESARDAAVVSETNAQGHAAAASTSEQNSANSANQAGQHATASAGHASAAQTSANDAEGASASAATSAELAARIGPRGASVIDDPLFARWGVDRWANWGDGPTSVIDNEVYPDGQTLAFNIDDSTQTGVWLYNSTGWTGAENADAYVVEVEFTLESGTLTGAGVLLDWDVPTDKRVQKTLESMLREPVVLGQVMVAQAIFRRPNMGGAAFTDHDCYLLMNWVGFGEGIAAKNIKLHRTNIRVATDEELGAGVVGAEINAAVNQEAIARANDVSALTVTQANQQSQIENVEANVNLQGVTLATIDGKVQSMTGLTAETIDVNGVTRISGIRATSYADPNGSGGSLLELIGDNVVAEGTLSTNRLVVGLGRNLLPNTDFSDGLQGWYFAANGDQAAQTSISVRGPGVWAGAYFPVLQIYQNGGVGFGGVADLRCRPSTTNGVQSVGVPVTPGDFIEVSAKLSIHRCVAELRIQYYDVNGASVAYSPVLASGNNVSSSGSNPDIWPVYWGKHQVPAGAAFATMHLRKQPTNTGTSSYLFIHKPQLAITHEAATEPAPYSPGGSTIITGNKIQTGSIEASHLSVTSLSASGLAVFGGMLMSNNYVAGQSGWIIDHFGNAQFNDLTITGAQIVDGKVVKEDRSSISAQKITSNGTHAEITLAGGTTETTVKWFVEIQKDGSYDGSGTFSIEIEGANYHDPIHILHSDSFTLPTGSAPDFVWERAGINFSGRALVTGDKVRVRFSGVTGSFKATAQIATERLVG